MRKRDNMILFCIVLILVYLAVFLSSCEIISEDDIPKLVVSKLLEMDDLLTLNESQHAVIKKIYMDEVRSYINSLEKYKDDFSFQVVIARKLKWDSDKKIIRILNGAQQEKYSNSRRNWDYAKNIIMVFNVILALSDEQTSKIEKIIYNIRDSREGQTGGMEGGFRGGPPSDMPSGMPGDKRRTGSRDKVSSSAFAEIKPYLNSTQRDVLDNIKDDYVMEDFHGNGRDRGPGNGGRGPGGGMGGDMGGNMPDNGF